jgi:excisionase family DNA binding protein
MSQQEAERRRRQSERDHERNGSMTVTEWCEYRRVSRSMLYKLLAEGRGPLTHFVGKKRLISSEADDDWVRQREAEARETAAA